LRELFDNFCKLYSVSSFFDCNGSISGSFVISIGYVDYSAKANVVISEIGFSGNIINIVPPVDSLEIGILDEKVLQFFLEYIFDSTAKTSV
jgi:hypothetical protein